MSPSPARRPPGPPASATGLLLLVVLVAAGYDRVRGLTGSWALAVTVAALATLLSLDLLDRRRPAGGTGAAWSRLLLRAAAVEVAAALEVSGTAQVLHLVVVFSAYFLVGLRPARVLAAGYAVLLVAGTARADPTWWDHPATVSRVLMSATGLAFALVAAAAVDRSNRRRAAALELAAELEESRRLLRDQAEHEIAAAAAQERNHLAREIHDGVGHHLTAATIQLQKAAAYLDRDPEVARAAVGYAADSAARALADVRRSVGMLGAGHAFELGPAVRQLLAPLRDHPPAVTLTIVGTEAGLDEAVLMTTFRVVQESLTNIRRHAAAEAVAVTIRLDAAAGVRARIEDDGRGLGPDPGTGHGLTGMQARAQQLGGRLEVGSGAAAGTVVTLRLPPRVASRWRQAGTDRGAPVTT